MDWATELAESEKHKLEREHHREEQEAHDKKELDSQAEHKWHDVRRAFKQCVGDFNAAMGSNYLVLNDGEHSRLILQAAGRKDARLNFVNFDRPRCLILAERGRTYTLRLVHDTAFWMDRAEQTYTAERIAQLEIQEALK